MSSFHHMAAMHIAPHAFHPPHEGASIRSWQMALALDSQFRKSSYAASSAFIFDLRKPNDAIQFGSQSRPKLLAGLICLLRNQMYTEARLMSARWRNRQKGHITHTPADVFVTHFVMTVPWLLRTSLAGKTIVLDTHNDEVEWYTSYSESTQSPFIRMVCKHSIRRALDYIKLIPSHWILSHVSEKDKERYSHYRPDLKHVVVRNVSHFQQRAETPDYDGEIKSLLFFGSLYGKMNHDALELFANHFWPKLSDKARMTVAGINPTSGVRNLCEREGWRLIENVPDDELPRLLGSVHFVVLPFSYGAGTKHKWATACSSGIPVLSTKAGAGGQKDIPDYAFVSDDPLAWRKRMLDFRMTESLEESICEYRKRNSWENSVEPLRDALSDTFIAN